MFEGDTSFDGAPAICNFTMLISFLTTVLVLAQDDDMVIPLLDIIQSIFCWPSFFEGAILAGCLWSFRHIERMIGTRTAIYLFVYSFIFYGPVYAILIFIYGFRKHISLFYFIPFSLFIFAFWRLPLMQLSGGIGDKGLICIMFFVVMFLSFPFSVVPLVTSIIGYKLWSLDSFGFVKRNQYDLIDEEDRVRSPIVDRETPIITTEHNNQPSYQEQLNDMVSMGFGHQEAESALARFDGNMEQAVNFMLESR